MLYQTGILAIGMGAWSTLFSIEAPPTFSDDWLVNPVPYVAHIRYDADNHQVILENGLTRRVVLVTPNAATIDYHNVTTGEQLVRAVGPEASVTINGIVCAIGGLEGQPGQGFLKKEWLGQLRDNSAANTYHFTTWREEPLTARFPWKKRPAWLAKDYPWPAPGKQMTLFFAPPAAQNNFPEIAVHYALYDGIPLIEKWLTIRNATVATVRINKTIVEMLKTVETESAVESLPTWRASNLYVESDYTFCAMNSAGANKNTVRWLTDKGYKTQVNYGLETPCALEVAPEFGPEVDLPPGKELTSIRVFELFHDSTERERRGLAQRRMYRTIAPWTQENPIMVHLVSSKPDAIRNIIDQAAEVGIEMVILSFGSGVNMEKDNTAYQKIYRECADYAATKGIVLGAYSLLASRSAGTQEDNCGGPGSRVNFGKMPCLGATWGQQYLTQLQSFISNAHFGVLEHDGSYPADTCAKTNHPGHRGLEDSQWAQWTAITNFYQWCRAQGVYLNVPDWYYLNGSNKNGMGYRETNWSLPRDEQEIIERQNIFDGTWEKTSSMGWMFVPLTQYHGGGAAATIEPLSEHLDHYEARLSHLFGAGVQACYRGLRIYDTEQTKTVVKKWILFYRQHREVLDADIVHMRRPDGRDWDGFVHVNPQGVEKALAVFYNPLATAIERTLRIPLHYAGLQNTVQVAVENAAPQSVMLDRTDTMTVTVTIPAHGRTWMVVTK